MHRLRPKRLGKSGQENETMPTYIHWPYVIHNLFLVFVALVYLRSYGRIARLGRRSFFLLEDNTK